MLQKTTALPLLLFLAACCDDHDDPPPPPPPPPPNLTSILVEVYDPTTNLVWQNVGVRIVEADQEWSQCTCVSPYQDIYLTDASGLVLLDEYRLAAADVGFLEDTEGRAVLMPGGFEDEATVLIEVAAEGFTPVLVLVPVRWSEPDVVVSVPFH